MKVGTDITDGVEYAVKVLSKLKFANVADRCVRARVGEGLPAGLARTYTDRDVPAALRCAART